MPFTADVRNEQRRMKKEKTRNVIPDLEEFTDEEGNKWVQTSTDDLFSMGELNEIFKSIEKERDRGEVVLARIDFQKVDREYYTAAVELQKRLKKQQDLLKKVVVTSREALEKKNSKLKELIEYIRKLHTFLAYLSSKDKFDESDIPAHLTIRPEKEEIREEAVYEDVEEVVLDPEQSEDSLNK